jgi:hypothetical protein
MLTRQHRHASDLACHSILQQAGCGTAGASHPDTPTSSQDLNPEKPASNWASQMPMLPSNPLHRCIAAHWPNG